MQAFVTLGQVNMIHASSELSILLSSKLRADYIDCIYLHDLVKFQMPPGLCTDAQRGVPNEAK